MQDSSKNVQKNYFFKCFIFFMAITPPTSWWRHQMETFSALLALCVGNSPVTGEFPVQRPVTRSFGVVFDLRLNKRLSKQSWGWWFEKQSRPWWRHRNGYVILTTLRKISFFMMLKGPFMPIQSIVLNVWVWNVHFRSKASQLSLIRCNVFFILTISVSRVGGQSGGFTACGWLTKWVFAIWPMETFLILCYSFCKNLSDDSTSAMWKHHLIYWQRLYWNLAIKVIISMNNNFTCSDTPPMFLKTPGRATIASNSQNTSISPTVNERYNDIEHIFQYLI